MQNLYQFVAIVGAVSKGKSVSSLIHQWSAHLWPWAVICKRPFTVMTLFWVAGVFLRNWMWRSKRFNKIDRNYSGKKFKLSLVTSGAEMVKEISNIWEKIHNFQWNVKENEEQTVQISLKMKHESQSKHYWPNEGVWLFTWNTWMKHESFGGRLNQTFTTETLDKPSGQWLTSDVRQTVAHLWYNFIYSC